MKPYPCLKKNYFCNTFRIPQVLGDPRLSQTTVGKLLAQLLV